MESKSHGLLKQYGHIIKSLKSLKRNFKIISNQIEEKILIIKLITNGS